MNLRIDSIAPYVFLGLSVILAAIFTPFALTSDKLSTVNLETSVSLNFSYSLETNLIKAIQLIQSANSSIDLSFRSPQSFTHLTEFQNFQDSLKAAHQKGIKIRLYTQKSNYKAPEGINIKYFPRNDLEFYVNLMIIDGKDVFLPSSFLPENYTLLYTFSAYITSIAPYANVFFEYLWNLPKSGHYAVAKRVLSQSVFNTTSPIGFTWDPSAYFPLSKTKMSSKVVNALDGVSENKYLISRRFFHDSLYNDDYSDLQLTAYHTALLETPHFEDNSFTLLTMKDNACDHYNEYKEVHANFDSSSFSLFYGRSYQTGIEGTIVAASELGMMTPASYDEIFRSNVVALGFYYDGPELYDQFSKFIEEPLNDHFSRMTQISRC